MKAFWCILILAVSAQAVAKSDVDLSKVKHNAEVSEANYRDVEKAESIAKANLNKFDSAIKQLGEMKIKVEKNAVLAGQNQKELDGNVAKINKMIADEKTLMTQEEIYLAALREKIKAAQERQAKRQENIAAYELKKVEIESEKREWQGQKENVNEIVEILAGKQKEAHLGLKKWQSELSRLEKDKAHWQNQAKQSTSVYKKVKSFEVKDSK